MTTLITPDSLTSFGRELFRASGMDEGKAATVARLLVLGDMMGRQTHGMALAPLYLDQLEKKMMQPTGELVCVKDTGSTVLWEGNYLPGLWLVDEAGAASAGEGHLLAATRRIDLESQLGPLSGALGVLQCAAAAAHLEGGGATGSVLATAGGTRHDATAALLLTPSPATRPSTQERGQHP